MICIQIVALSLFNVTINNKKAAINTQVLNNNDDLPKTFPKQSIDKRPKRHNESEWQKCVNK